MSKYPSITITFTINPDDVTLKAQATCDNMSRGEIIMALDKLKKKIESDEFQTLEDGAYYSEESFPLHEPTETTIVDDGGEDEWDKVIEKIRTINNGEYNIKIDMELLYLLKENFIAPKPKDK